MHSEYGTNYQIVIKQEREKLLERLAKREKYNQWATIKELVDMNCKLLGKIP